MNKMDRAELDAILSRLRKSQEEIAQCREDIDRIRSSEEDKYGNLPESLQDGQKGSEIQDAIDKLESIGDNLDETDTYLSYAIEEVEEMV